MSPTRRLTGIAAMSAGALAAAGMSTPLAAAEAPADEPPPHPAGDGLPADVLAEWEAQRGIDLPDELLLKLDGVAGESELDALIKWQYQPAGEDGEPLLLKIEYQDGVPVTDSALDKASPVLAEPQAQAFEDAMEAALIKMSDVLEPGAVGDLSGWDFAAGSSPAEDAFIKLELSTDATSDGPALIKWEYRALDLVESALIKVEDAGLEGDPDRPIASLLEVVRDLRAAGPSANPFTVRDREMDRLPLPKKLPADAGTYAAPKAGIWRSVNLPGTVVCEGVRSRIPRTVSGRVSLRLEDEGRRILGRDLAQPGSTVVLDAVPGISGRFTGTVELEEQGGRVSMDLTMQLVTDERIVGQAEVTVKAAGQRCTVTRGFDMTWKGE